MAAETINAPGGRGQESFAPRIPSVASGRTGMSDAAAAVANPLAALNRMTIHGSTPLGAAGTTSGAIDVLEEASALLVLIGAGWSPEGDVQPPNAPISETIHARAMDGIQTLIALAVCYIKEAEA